MRKKLITTGAIILTILISTIEFSATVNPKYQEFETHKLLLDGEEVSELNLGTSDLIACYGTNTEDSEFYINNELITDLEPYVLHKTYKFSGDGKLKIADVKLTDDILNSTLKMKVRCGDEWYIGELKDITFKSVDETEIWIWYDLNQVTKENVLKSKGTTITMTFTLEVE